MNTKPTSQQTRHLPSKLGAVATTVFSRLEEVLSITFGGATGDGTDETAEIQLAVNEAANSGRTLYVPDGVFAYTHLTVPAGKDLVIVGSSKEFAVLKQLNPTASNLPGIACTGSLIISSVCIDQSWLTSGLGAYRDDRNPATWGGYWAIHAVQAPTQTLSITGCRLKDVCRGAFSQAANPSVGGAASVIFTDNISTALVGDSQTLIAADAPFNMVVSDNPQLVTKQWNEGASYLGNGISWVIAWGGANVKIENNTCVGYQLVARGPRNTLWTPNTTYAAFEEYLNVDVTYKVTTAYTSGAVFGALDLANTVTTFNPSSDISVSGNRLQSPVADTAIYGWARAIVSGNIITGSGDMGIAASGSQELVCTGNIIDGVRNGGIDLTGQGIVTCTGNVVVDIARASDGVYQRIDTLNPNVWASNGGFNLAAITIGLPTGNGVKNVTISGNTCAFKTLPPVSDGGPNNGGLVRAQVLGIYNAVSSNLNAFGTVTTVGNRVEDYVADMPMFMVNVPTLRFYNQSVTDTPKVGEVFSAADGTKFVLCASLGSGSFVFVRKFQGRVSPDAGQVFVGTSSGATIVTAGLPQATFLLSTEAGNYDHTSKHIGDTLSTASHGITYVGSATVNPSAVANGAMTAFAIPVANAVVGDFVAVATPYQIQGLQLTAYVSNFNEVTVVLKNDTGNTIDLGSGVWKARVIKV